MQRQIEQHLKRHGSREAVVRAKAVKFQTFAMNAAGLTLVSLMILAGLS